MNIQNGQTTGLNRVLEAVALGKSLTEILHLTTQSIENELPGSFASVLLANENGTRLFSGSADSLPAEYNDAIDGIHIGEAVGSCGTAAFRREMVIVSDILNDPLWADFRELTEAHNLRSCWSQPIFSPTGKLHGTFAVYFPTPREPQADDLALLESVARIAGIAIEHKYIEKDLKNVRTRLEATLTASEVATWTWDIVNDQVFADKNLARLFSVSDDIAAGGAIENYLRVLHPEDCERLVALLSETVESGDYYETEYRILQPDDTVCWVIARGHVERDTEGTPVNLSGVLLDITERKKAEQEREKLLASEQEARAEAEKSNSLKDEFLATLSHELRTPLNAILGWTQIMLRQKLGESEQLKALTVIDQSARSQNQLIEDILDVSRIITGKMRLDVRAVSLLNVISSAIESARPGAEAKDIKLQTILDPEATAVSGDSDRLQQVIWNLLSNAIKFTPKGGRVQIRLERVNSSVETTISDTGKGIEPEFLPFVFDRFRQSDGSTTRRQGGLGLGLAIVRQIVELHGGSVSVNSAGEGEGSSFTVSLPVMPVRQEPESGSPRIHPKSSNGGSVTDEINPDELKGLRILIVDDEADSQEVLTMLLDSSGAQVKAADSAGEALKIIKCEKFDVLISDIGMPGEDGFALIEKIRKLSEEEGGKTPAIALTAYARSEDRIKALRSGFQMHIAKPVEYSELIAVILALAGRVNSK